MCLPLENLTKEMCNVICSLKVCVLTSKNVSMQDSVYSRHARLTQGLLQFLFTFFDWKTSKWAYHLLQFFISYWEKFFKLIKFITQFYVLLLNLFFFFFSIFSVFLKDYFCRWLAYKAPFSTFLVLINCIMWYYNLLRVSSCFPRHGPGFSGSESGVWDQVSEVSPTLVHIFS